MSDGPSQGGEVAHDPVELWRGLVFGFVLGTTFWAAFLLLFL